MSPRRGRGLNDHDHADREPATRSRWAARRALRGHADDRPRRHRRERRAAVHPRDLGFSQSGLAWVVNAYLVAFGGLLLLAGRLGDLVSRRGVFLAGLAVFTVASVVCGAAQ